MHGSWDPYVDHNSPLYARKDEVGNATYFNTDWGVKYWLNSGLPKEKLVLGLALYGRTFKLENPQLVNHGDPAKGPGEAGKYHWCLHHV